MGRSGLADLLDRGTAPDVVVCSSDVLAHGALIEAQARGIAVPRDLAIVGFGDLSFAQYIVPSLSTVRVDGEKIGRIAAEAVLARLGGDPAPQIHDVGFGFVDRESA
jgi:LacI family gluconate utilization system Gnt-I transcriptional repressor